MVRIRPRGARRTGAALLGVPGWKPPRRLLSLVLPGRAQPGLRGGAGWEGSVGTGGKAGGGAAWVTKVIDNIG